MNIKELLEEIESLEGSLIDCEPKQEKQIKRAIREARTDLIDLKSDSDEREFDITPEMDEDNIFEDLFNRTCEYFFDDGDEVFNNGIFN